MRQIATQVIALNARVMEYQSTSQHISQATSAQQLQAQQTIRKGILEKSEEIEQLLTKASKDLPLLQQVHPQLLKSERAVREQDARAIQKQLWEQSARFQETIQKFRATELETMQKE